MLAPKPKKHGICVNRFGMTDENIGGSPPNMV
jgi:hypothetical protein